ncbi:hypothetical protein H8356DRAFT_1725098 [Neocallimastix lanati (nom. inval.)]|nr:hypothetical protein H8356DRAFT_1725098 [Neocallimastix sp. JGI-2020a]
MLDEQYFIENPAEASFTDWLRSKGTNYTCYIEYINAVGDAADITEKLNIFQTIIYIIHTPFKFTFFYWTIVVFILHKFNFKKTVMKIISLHFILRSIGDILNQVGNLMDTYYSNTEDGLCSNIVFNPEKHPLRWFVTRQIASIFWYSGEIFADWYPLIRTKAISHNFKYIKYVYITCLFYNLSKIALIFLNFKLSPSELYDSRGIYDNDKVNHFYDIFWIFQLIKYHAAFIYEITVYIVMKKIIKKLDIDKSDIGFLKKFKNLSEYRMLLFALFSLCFLPFITFSVILKYYLFIDDGFRIMDFSLEEVRVSYTNIQYYMVFIDQIFIFISKYETIPINIYAYDDEPNTNSFIMNKTYSRKLDSDVEFSH